MRQISRLLLLTVSLGVLALPSAAQSPDEKPASPIRGAPGDSVSAAGVNDFVARMMAFDKNKDGKLTRDEITDPRLLRLFDRADVNKDGVVTKEELVNLGTQMIAGVNAGGGRGPGGFGPPGGGPGGFGPPPRPGQILPGFLQNRLQLTGEQKKEIETLQKEVDDKLGKILTEQQKKQLENMRDRGPRFDSPGSGNGRSENHPALDRRQQERRPAK